MSTYLDIAKQIEARLHRAPVCVADATVSTEGPLAEAPCDGRTTPVEDATVPRVFPDFREWRTGKTPSSALIPLKAPLPKPRFHDRPSPPRIYSGRPCEKKACRGHRQRFWPSRMCTRCWERA